MLTRPDEAEIASGRLTSSLQRSSSGVVGARVSCGPDRNERARQSSVRLTHARSSGATASFASRCPSRSHAAPGSPRYPRSCGRTAYPECGCPKCGTSVCRDRPDESSRAAEADRSQLGSGLLLCSLWRLLSTDGGHDGSMSPCSGTPPLGDASDQAVDHHADLIELRV
jgi:hypothetical protein